jgi:hypothetical protein
MKIATIAGLVVLATFTGQAWAGCEAKQRLDKKQLEKLLPNSIVCARPVGGVSPNDRWQEEHRAGGQLWDFKRGPTDKMDPSKQVGTWAIVSLGTDAKKGEQAAVTYSYTGGSTHTRTVHLISGDVYSFCSGSSEIAQAIIRPGSGPCASYP